MVDLIKYRTLQLSAELVKQIHLISSVSFFKKSGKVDEERAAQVLFLTTKAYEILAELPVVPSTPTTPMAAMSLSTPRSRSATPKQPRYHGTSTHLERLSRRPRGKVLLFQDEEADADRVIAAARESIHEVLCCICGERPSPKALTCAFEGCGRVYCSKKACSGVPVAEALIFNKNFICKLHATA